jgi:hypothetical protein
MFHPAFPCYPVSFNRPSPAVEQRALAKQVPRLVEKHWLLGGWRDVLRVVTY